jgi:hypothetical protein
MQVKEMNFSHEMTTDMWKISKNKYKFAGDSKLLKLAMLLYSIVMMGAAALILVVYEKIANLSIYFIYLSVGVILGLSVIVLIHIFSKEDEF